MRHGHRQREPRRGTRSRLKERRDGSEQELCRPLVLTLNLKTVFVGTWCSLFTSVLVSTQKIFSDCWNHLQHLQQGHKLGESKLWCQWCRQGQTTIKPPNHISITEILLLHSFPIVPIAGTSIENSETFHSRRNRISSLWLRFPHRQMISRPISWKIHRLSLKWHLQKSEMCQKKKHTERAIHAFSRLVP